MARAGSLSRWSAWLGGAVALGCAAFLAGVGGLLGQPKPAPTNVGIVGTIAGETEALDCPHGEPVAWLTPGEQVFATARTDDGEHVAIRIPGKEYETVWVRVLALEFVLEVDSLPTATCVTPVIEGMAP